MSAGAPLDLVVYCDLTGQPVPIIETYTQLLRFWYPLRDFLAYRELRSKGLLSFRRWLQSVASFEHVSPLWSFHDLLPAVGAAAAIMQRLVRGQE